jgi:copper(I)-binding protein
MATSFIAGPVSASTNKSVVIADATVTAARAHGNSAVELTITNDLKGPISLTSVSSPVSGMSMIYYDENMCQGNHAMAWLANIFIEPGHVQRLSLKFQGAMLGALHSPLVKGSTVPLVLKWSDFQKASSVTVEAKVIAAPKGLHFHMTAMNMKM